MIDSKNESWLMKHLEFPIRLSLLRANTDFYGFIVIILQFILIPHLDYKQPFIDKGNYLN